MKIFPIIILVILLIPGILMGCGSPLTTTSQDITAEKIIADINQRVGDTTSYAFSAEANAFRSMEKDFELSTQIIQNGLVALQESRGKVETTTITRVTDAESEEETETKIQSICIDGDTVYFGEAVDGSEIDYDIANDTLYAIKSMDILNQDLKFVNSANVTLLPTIERVENTDCYVISLSLDMNELLNIMIIPSVYEILALENTDVDVLIPYIKSYSYKLWFGKENLELLKVHQFMELKSDETDGNLSITYEWNRSYSRYNEELEIMIPVAASDAVIHDSLLAEGIREALGKPSGTITQEDLASLRELDVSNYGVNHITGLEYCVNLESLSLSLFAEYPDIRPLTNLTKLKTLKISGVDNTDLTPLANLVNLTSLELSSLDPIDISPILSLPNITTLSLDWTGDLDITRLKSFPKLTSLTLYVERGITDLAPLLSLNLTEIDINASAVSDISPLALMKNLQSITFIGAKVTDISPLGELNKLEFLELEINDGADFTPLSKMYSLKRLRLSRHKIRDVSIFNKLINLQSLILDRNNISDITPLSNLRNLTELELDFNDITDLTPLSSLTKLQHLSISNMEIKDITPLAGLINLNYLQIAVNDVSDISIIANLKDLQEFYLGSNNVSDISCLKDLTELRYLAFSQNQVSDITSLVENSGIGTGDEVSLSVELTNKKMEDIIKILESRGVIVTIW
jgi:Leucine-rich repeat (LRR) protein